MFANLTNALDFQAKGLVLRAERQRVIASNIANADTPGFSGRDFNFKQALADATGEGSNLTLALSSSRGLAGDGTTHARHIPLPNTQGAGQNGDAKLDYTTQSQPAKIGRAHV